MENVATLEPEEHAQWCLDLRQSDGDEVRSGVVLCDDEQHELQGSKARVRADSYWLRVCIRMQRDC